jgi:hypothetical protein
MDRRPLRSQFQRGRVAHSRSRKPCQKLVPKVSQQTRPTPLTRGLHRRISTGSTLRRLLMSGTVPAGDRPHRRPATHVPEHKSREPTPCQEPPPELVDRCPLPLADETLTLTAPLLDTLPLAAPDTTPSWISTPKAELGLRIAVANKSFAAIFSILRN